MLDTCKYCGNFDCDCTCGAAKARIKVLEKALLEALLRIEELNADLADIKKTRKR